MIGDEILRAVRPTGSEAQFASGTVRFGGYFWRRVLVTLRKRSVAAAAVELVASEIEKRFGLGREKWGPHLVAGTVMFAGKGWHAFVMADGFRHLNDAPAKTGIVEVLFRYVSHTRVEAVPWLALPGDPKSDPKIRGNEEE